MLAFEWRWRQLFIWHFSLADYILRTQTAAEWCRDFLNPAIPAGSQMER